MKNNNLEHKIEFLISGLFYGLIIFSSFFILKHIVPVFTPFLVGFFIAFILRPITEKMCEKTKINGKVCGIVVVIFSYILIFFFIWLISCKIAEFLRTFLNSSPEIYKSTVLPTLNTLAEQLNKILLNLLPNSNFKIQDIIENMFYNIDDFVTSTAKYILSIMAKTGKNIPNFLINITFSIISSIYFSYDYEKITTFIVNLFPKKTQHILIKTKGYTITTIIKYIKAYMLLMLISFCLLSIGFFIIKVKNPIGVAALISLFDAIPFVGSGIVILPWALVIVGKNFNMAIGLITIFLVLNLARSFLEPKILGASLGIHPLATLISVYVGAKILGFLGIIFAPIAIQIAFSLYKYKKSKY